MNAVHVCQLVQFDMTVLSANRGCKQELLHCYPGCSCHLRASNWSVSYG